MTSQGRGNQDRNHNAKTTPGIAYIAVLALCLASCSGGNAPDVSHIDGSFELVRTEQILFGLDSTLSSADALPLFTPQAAFWELYFTRIMADDADVRIPDQPFNLATASWRPLVTNPYLRAIADSVDLRYAQMEEVQAQFTTAFQYLQYYFPGNRPPTVYTLISGFGFFPFIFEDGERDGLGISLEMFLGSEFPYRSFVGNNPAFSNYLVRTFNRDHLARKAVEVIVDDLAGFPNGNRLLDQMVHNGKKLYLLELLLPGISDTVLFEFKPAQVRWCEAHERDLWAHFLTDDLLYSSEFSKIQKLVNPSPSVSGIPPEAPGGVANWTGWRIIHTLVQRNPDLKPIDILAMRDAQAIVEMARYRPK
jgi:hypothetical protein